MGYLLLTGFSFLRRLRLRRLLRFFLLEAVAGWAFTLVRGGRS